MRSNQKERRYFQVMLRRYVDVDEHCDERSHFDFQETRGGYLRIGVWHILVTGKKKEMSRISTSIVICCSIGSASCMK